VRLLKDITPERFEELRKMIDRLYLAFIPVQEVDSETPQ
jgi:hypothetical protein